MSNAVPITSEDFEKEVLKSETPVLVDFWAEWCGPCKMIAPSVDAIAAEYSDKLKVFKLDVDKEPDAEAENRGENHVPFGMIAESPFCKC